MKNFSYKNIAKEAGVSISTVSRYYRGGYVSKETKKVIANIIKENDYYPNHGARTIRGRDTSIFIIVPEWYENSYTQIMNGIEQGAKTRNRKVIITHSSPNPEEYIETIKYVSSWKPMAIVFFLPEDPQNTITNYIKNTNFESNILVYGKEVETLNWIKIDEENSFHHLTSRFINYIDKGEKVVFVEDVKLTEEQKRLRRIGFENACKKLNVAYEIYSLKNKNNKEVQFFLNYLRNNNLVNVVCSTHEVFINLISSGDRNLRLTDIGWVSIYDYQHKYKAKIFIDYPAVGLEIEKMLYNCDVDNTIENKIYKPKILFDN